MPRSDILVFLTGQEEIEAMAAQVRLISKDLPHTGIKLLPLTLYAAQQTSVQQKVFFPTKPGSRKVILATNIAETSLTIPGIRYVIDSCRVKAKYDAQFCPVKALTTWWVGACFNV